MKSNAETMACPTYAYLFAYRVETFPFLPYHPHIHLSFMPYPYSLQSLFQAPSDPPFLPLLKQTQELALLQPLLIPLQFFQQRILLGLGLGSRSFFGLDGLLGTLSLGDALLAVLEDQLHGRSGPETDG